MLVEKRKRTKKVTQLLVFSVFCRSLRNVTALTESQVLVLDIYSLYNINQTISCQEHRPESRNVRAYSIQMKDKQMHLP